MSRRNPRNPNRETETILRDNIPYPGTRIDDRLGIGDADYVTRYRSTPFSGTRPTDWSTYAVPSEEHPLSIVTPGGGRYRVLDERDGESMRSDLNRSLESIASSINRQGEQLNTLREVMIAFEAENNNPVLIRIGKELKLLAKSSWDSVKFLVKAHKKYYLDVIRGLVSPPVIAEEDDDEEESTEPV